MDVVFGIDVDPDAAATFRKNFPEAEFVLGDIKEYSVESLAPLLIGDARATLFCGCAPCQPFSKQNRQKSSLDSRRNLLSEFARFIVAWLPDYIFVENVPGLQRIRRDDGPLARFTNLLSSLNYHFVIEVVPALRFGVPQTRERLIIIASKLGSIALPPPSHGVNGCPVSTVREWISGLPALEAGETDPNDPDHCAAQLSDINLERISATPEGGTRTSWPKHLWLDCHKLHKGHTDVYGRLSWDKPAAGLTTRCISYSNGRFGHPDQNRAITVREAARLQTFPHDYVFTGSLGSKARQIGNAVPPLMAQRIGEQICLHALSRGKSGFLE